jgi:hypothetical protein
MDGFPYVLGVTVCGLAAALALALALRDTCECAARNQDSKQGPEAQDGTDKYSCADHGQSQLAGRFTNTSHTHSFR